MTMPGLDDTVQKELLEVYNLEGNPLGPLERDVFYRQTTQEFERDGTINRMVKSIRMLLLNPAGRVYLQERSIEKSENPGLLDKTVGGHVTAGVSYDLTLVKECAEELGLPAAVVSTHEFDTAVRSIDLKVIALCRDIEYIAPFNSVRIMQDGSRFVQPFMSTFYIGYYDGAIRFADGESSGIKVLSLEQLSNQIRTNPNLFTEDLKFMIERYESHLRPLRA